MHQRHSIGVDKSRALTAGSDRQMSSSNQVSFHKIYRQKRRYSTFDKGKEGHYCSQWRSEYANTSRDSNEVLEPRYTVGSNAFKTTRRVDCRETIKSGSPSSLFLSDRDFAKCERDFARSDRDFPKRSFDRFSCTFASGLEFDAPVAKKQKVEFYKSSAPQHYASPDFDRGNPKSPLDETKWMYKNQHGKMSGPYGVKQLMEGLQARFLQEDLPIYQLHEGKLCKPVMLKQLMDDSQWSVRDSGWRHSNQGMPSQRLVQGPIEESVGQVADDIDLPPGFGGRSSQFTGKSSCDYSPSSTVSVADPRCATRGFSSLGSEFGDHDACLPPGFEGGAATESHTSAELCESPRRLSMAAWREKVQAVHSSYEQREPMVQDRVHSSWQGNSPHPMVSFPKQGNSTHPMAKAGNENFSNGHTTWAYPPAASKLSSFESQAFSQPAVCIGLPVSNPATQSWPIASTLPSGASKAEPYGYLNASAPLNHTLATKEPIGVPQMHGPDPLTLILTELLAAVKRTYVNSVLSALIGEQLECWLDANKSWTGSSSSPEKNSSGRGACHQLSRAEVNKGSVEASVSHIEATGSPEASTLCMKSTTSTLHLKSLSRVMPGSAEASASHIEASSSPEVSTLRVEASTANTTSSHPDVASQLRDDAQCAEGSLVTHEASVGSEPNQTSSPVLKDEKHHQSAEENSIDHGGAQSSGNVFNAARLEPRLLPLATRSKKGNLKSLKQLMLITSKLRSRQSKNSLLKKSASKVTCGKSAEVLEIRQRSGLPQGYDGCARTSICGSTWLTRGQVDGNHLERCQNEGQCSKTGEKGVSTRIQTRAQSAQSRSAPVVSLTGCSEGADAVKLTLSKVRKRELKVARSNIHKWGVFSVDAIEAGDFVTEYVGEVVRSRIADSREEQYAKSGVEGGYVFRIDKDCAVDATKRGGLARFINHSCDPNCFIKIVSTDKSKRILIFAQRQIHAGEEVTFNYMSVHGALNVMCRCGSPECQGSSVW